jgi:hypothetical protein
LRSGAWSLQFACVQARGRCTFATLLLCLATQAQANNQQIYLDQVRSTGQRQPQAI